MSDNPFFKRLKLLLVVRLKSFFFSNSLLGQILMVILNLNWFLLWSSIWLKFYWISEAFSQEKNETMDTWSPNRNMLVDVEVQKRSRFFIKSLNIGSTAVDQWATERRKFYLHPNGRLCKVYNLCILPKHFVKRV